MKDRRSAPRSSGVTRPPEPRRVQVNRISGVVPVDEPDTPAAAHVAATGEFRTRAWAFIEWLTFLAIEPKGETPPLVSGVLPEPSLSPSIDKKVDILLSLHNAVRESIHKWEDRMFHAFIFSSGAIVSGVGYFLQHQENIGQHRDDLIAALMAFGFAAIIYLLLAARAHAQNGVTLVKIEAALGLCAEGRYLRGRRFVGYSGKWVHNWRAPILLGVLACLIGFAAYTILSTDRPKPGQEKPLEAPDAARVDPRRPASKGAVTAVPPRRAPTPPPAGAPAGQPH